MSAPEPTTGFPPPAAQPAEIELRPATINDRFIAYVIDVAPFAAGYSLTLILGPSRLSFLAPYLHSLRQVAALWLAAYVLYEWLGNMTGGTVGKRMMGIGVVKKDGQPLGFIRSLVRALAYLLSTPFFNFGFVIALFHPESRALHDLLSGSLVIEPRPKNKAEAGLMFFAAVCLMAGLYGGTLFLTFSRQTPADLVAIERAQDGLKVLAQVEEAYKTANGHYTQSLGDLARASGDVAQFQKAMVKIFEPNLFKVRVDLQGYRISGAARDRKKTRVAIAGPPAALVP